MISQDIRELKTGPRELRKFGLVVGSVLIALGLFFLLRGKPYHFYWLIPGVLLLLIGIVRPKSLKHVYIGWMSMAIVMGFVVASVILSLFFFLVVTPIGLASRLAGKDFLKLKLDRRAETYWIPRQPRINKQHYERQF